MPAYEQHTRLSSFAEGSIGLVKVTENKEELVHGNTHNEDGWSCGQGTELAEAWEIWVQFTALP